MINFSRSYHRKLTYIFFKNDNTSLPIQSWFAPILHRLRIAYPYHLRIQSKINECVPTAILIDIILEQVEYQLFDNPHDRRFLIQIEFNTENFIHIRNTDGLSQSLNGNQPTALLLKRSKLEVFCVLCKLYNIFLKICHPPGCPGIVYTLYLADTVVE